MLSHLHQYIPTVTEKLSAQVDEEPVEVTKDTFYPTLIGKIQYVMEL